METKQQPTIHMVDLKAQYSEIQNQVDQAVIDEINTAQITIEKSVPLD